MHPYGKRSGASRGFGDTYRELNGVCVRWQREGSEPRQRKAPQTCDRLNAAHERGMLKIHGGRRVGVASQGEDIARGRLCEARGKAAVEFDLGITLASTQVDCGPAAVDAASQCPCAVGGEAAVVESQCAVRCHLDATRLVPVKAKARCTDHLRWQRLLVLICLSVTARTQVQSGERPRFIGIAHPQDDAIAGPLYALQLLARHVAQGGAPQE